MMTGSMTETSATIRTTGGQTLAYADYGDRDGVPVFYFHGLPGSRLDFDGAIGHEALTGTGVRLLAVDRPGFGASDSQPGRRYEDWPAQVSTVADELGLGRFGVLGYSAGGPYVVACARALPERLTFAGILSGVGPAETPDFRRGMAKTDAVMTRLARLAPPLARLAIKQATRTAERSPEKFSRQFDKDLSAPDLEVHREPSFRQLVRQCFLEATRQGPDGVVHEYRLNATRWGFPLEEVGFPIHLWQGDADAIVPPHHAEYLTRRLANATLTILPGVGHLHTPARWHDVLAAAAKHQSAST
jgi:pimeloyl-ACP methyl ester carboxylesterase